MTTKDIEQSVSELEVRAEKLRELLKYAPRPFVIEFAGTPKSGKSTSVESIRHFFSRHGFRVHVLAERAAVCPIPMKGHLFFNTWCATSMLAELLANIEADTDIIIVDRGLFDALVWLALQERRGELTGEEARRIESFLLLDRWCTLTDLVVVMEVLAEEALTRETLQRITQKPGSIMNSEVLAAISEAVNLAHTKYHKHFNATVKHNTGGEDIRTSGVRLANDLLDSLEQFLNPKVLVVPRKEIERLVSSGVGGGFANDAFQQALDCTNEYGSFIHRDEAENREDMVQIVTAGVLELNDRVFLFQRKETDPKYRLYGKTTIWQGSHVQSANGHDLADLLRKTLKTRLSRSLFISRVFQTNEVGYCWDQNDPKSSHHLGMMYSIRIDNPHTAADLRKKEFKRKRGESLVGEFVSWKDLATKADDLNLESWSKALLASRKVN